MLISTDTGKMEIAKRTKYESFNLRRGEGVISVYNFLFY